jgi:hypothetical protein
MTNIVPRRDQPLLDQRDIQPKIFARRNRGTTLCAPAARTFGACRGVGIALVGRGTHYRTGQRRS